MRQSLMGVGGTWWVWGGVLNAKERGVEQYDDLHSFGFKK